MVLRRPERRPTRSTYLNRLYEDVIHGANPWTNPLRQNLLLFCREARSKLQDTDLKTMGFDVPEKIKTLDITAPDLTRTTGSVTGDQMFDQLITISAAPGTQEYQREVAKKKDILKNLVLHQGVAGNRFQVFLDCLGGLEPYLSTLSTGERRKIPIRNTAKLRGQPNWEHIMRGVKWDALKGNYAPIDLLTDIIVAKHFQGASPILRELVKHNVLGFINTVDQETLQGNYHTNHLVQTVDNIAKMIKTGNATGSISSMQEIMGIMPSPQDALERLLETLTETTEPFHAVLYEHIKDLEELGDEKAKKVKEKKGWHANKIPLAHNELDIVLDPQKIETRIQDMLDELGQKGWNQKTPQWVADRLRDMLIHPLWFQITNALHNSKVPEEGYQNISHEALEEMILGKKREFEDKKNQTGKNTQELEDELRGERKKRTESIYRKWRKKFRPPLSGNQTKTVQKPLEEFNL